MDYEMLNKMKVAELKNFLRLRALKVTGRKCELVARAFAAIENNIAITKTAEEIEGEIADQYKRKLIMDGKTLPDPFQQLKSGWKNEEDGIAFWPMITTFYIIKYLMLDSEVEDLNDYKQSKAYIAILNKDG